MNSVWRDPLKLLTGKFYTVIKFPPVMLHMHNLRKRAY